MLIQLLVIRKKDSTMIDLGLRKTGLDRSSIVMQAHNMQIINMKNLMIYLELSLGECQ